MPLASSEGGQMSSLAANGLMFNLDIMIVSFCLQVLPRPIIAAHVPLK